MADWQLLVRTRRSFPQLAPLLAVPPPAGWELVDKPKGWRVLKVVGG